MKLFRYTAAGRHGVGLIRPGHDDQFIDLAKLDASLAPEMTPFYDDATRQRVAGLLDKAAASDFQQNHGPRVRRRHPVEFVKTT